MRFLKPLTYLHRNLKQQLEADAAKAGGLRLLDERFMLIRQAMGVAKSGEQAAATLCEFVEEMKRSGFVANALERHHIGGASLAPLERVARRDSIAWLMSRDLPATPAAVCSSRA